MSDDARLKFQKKLDAALEAHAKVGELLNDLVAMLGEGATRGQLVAQLFKIWPATWGERYGGKYVYSNRMAAMQVFKTLLATLSLEEVVARMKRYVESNDTYYVTARHPLELFGKSVNKFGDAPAEAFTLIGATGCTHTPRCKSDAEHTRRKSDELRGVKQ